MAQRLRRNHDFLKLLGKCTPAQHRAILREADDALVKTICECILNVLKETVGTLRYTTAGCYYGYFGREGLG